MILKCAKHFTNKSWKGWNHLHSISKFISCNLLILFFIKISCAWCKRWSRWTDHEIFSNGMMFQTFSKVLYNQDLDLAFVCISFSIYIKSVVNTNGDLLKKRYAHVNLNFFLVICCIDHLKYVVFMTDLEVV